MPLFRLHCISYCILLLPLTGLEHIYIFFHLKNVLLKNHLNMAHKYSQRVVVVVCFVLLTDVCS